MERIKNSNEQLPWKLVWDAETKDVLFLRRVEGEFQTVNELFEAKNKYEIHDKIAELGLKYDPSIQEEEEWV